MKKEIVQRIAIILVMLAVMVYTFFNYHSGKIDFLYFVVFMAVLAYPLVGNILKVIEDLKNP